VKKEENYQMKEDLQKILSKDSCPTKDRAELESMLGVQTFMWISETGFTGSGRMGMLEHILNPENLRRAYRQVVSNKGASGIDRMEVTELKSYLQTQWEAIRQSILSGNYKP
jgi:hypothetical protein